MGAETDLPWLSTSTEDVFKRESDSWRSCSSPLEKKKKMKGMRAGVKVIDRSFYSNRRLQGHDFRGQWLSRWRRRRVDFLFFLQNLVCPLTYFPDNRSSNSRTTGKREREREIEGWGEGILVNFPFHSFEPTSLFFGVRDEGCVVTTSDHLKHDNGILQRGESLKKRSWRKKNSFKTWVQSTVNATSFLSLVLRFVWSDRPLLFVLNSNFCMTCF